ncbi:MAG: universal stress protein [Richelia sp. RM2_1_2]|nr:universal stress protein [Richelia sp. SM1_7_0]NJN08274.1 universal stress protein [Richelia sp. RM1_1_1]NJO26348.1 universal stress protein [Richelia sp. SL_2_1]NJO57595.1 universal stress protein [Richelia sp. RM2_1_2]
MINHKILVALDKSKQTGKVFQTALDLVKGKDSEIKLLHCINSNIMVGDVSSIGGIGTIGDINIYGNLQKNYQQELKQEIRKVSEWSEYYTQQARMQKIPASYTYELGEPGKKICEFAQSWGADLIVLGSRGHSGITEVLLGSVSNYVIHHACCSVLVVK